MQLSQFFTILSKELNQILESGDSDTGYQYINSEDLPFYINEKMAQMVSDNPAMFKEEYLHKFSGETSIFKLPAIFHKILGYYDTLINDWRISADCSNMNSPIRVVGDKSLYSVTPWQQGDEILLRVVKIPPEVSGESDVLVFPKHHLRLLRLEIIRTVLGSKGKGWSNNTQAEYIERKRAFYKETESIKKVTRLRPSGSRLGN